MVKRSGLMFVSILMLALAPAHAATIIIDFEDPNLPIGNFSTPLTTEGFTIVPTATGSQAPPAISDSTNIAGGTGNELLFCGACSDGDNGVSIYQAQGYSFELDAFDLGYQDIVFAGLVTGYLEAGGTVTQSLTAGGHITFDASWAGLTSIDVEFNTTSGPGFSLIGVDNIKLQAVPVPAAVWLFASGLGLLGWVRRKGIKGQTLK